MAQIEVKNVTFTYPDAAEPTLHKLNFLVPSGQFVVLCGPSGCGKTTLLRQIKQELAPVGTLEGKVLYEGRPLEQWTQAELAAQIGFVQQDPDNQLVTDRVRSELAFGLENLGLSVSDMHARLAELVQAFGLESWLDLPVHELSGGQKQMVNLAAVLAMRPKLLLLDEPTAQLDPIAARHFLQFVHRLNQEFGVTIVMTEHRLEELYSLSDRFVLMEKGKLICDGDPLTFIMQMKHVGTGSHPYIPSLARLYFAAAAQEKFIPSRIPLHVREGIAWFNELDPIMKSQTDLEKAKLQEPQTREETNRSEPLLVCQDVSFQYEKQQPVILQQLNFTVYEQDCLAILGGNGAGKSTLLQVLAGLLHPQRGRVYLQGRNLQTIKEQERNPLIGYLAQNPLLYFLHDTVERELQLAAQRSGKPDAQTYKEELVARLGLSALLKQHPYDLSGGERQKAALACVLLARPRILLLDEPTKGVDPYAKQEWGKLLLELQQEGKTIVIVTHDIEFAARYCNRCALLFDGDIAANGPTHLFFSSHYFYTTTIRRIVREVDPEATLVEDVLKRWGIAD